MRKPLIPLLACLALCGAAACALIASSANAQPEPHRPVMTVALVSPGAQLAANDMPDDAALPRPMDRAGGDRAARMKQMCQNGYARQAGILAYLQVRLDLTAAQEPLFDHWKDAKLAIARRRAGVCAQRPMPPRPAAERQNGEGRHNAHRADAKNRAPNLAGNLTDRLDHQEARLKQRLADLDAERPALEAFYNSLSPVQKTELGHGAMVLRARMGGGMGGYGMRRHRFAAAMGQRPFPPGPMTHGPLDGPPAR